MSWELILWIIFFFINIALLGSTFYQILCLSDLEADYMNPYESSSRINSIVVPDFILQGVLCMLFLLTWHWFLFLISVPITCYNAMLFMKRQHLIDVTEVFRTLSAEKKYRVAKLAFYLFLFIIVIIRLVICIFNSVIDEEDAVHIF
ncbi:protein cornichon homolog 1 isoform X2 [Vitis riparia]|uniref:protein cornichon homolog 1 isoform X2 n=1 Tax=Vitis riparia TaxID=96939 RepID=UPI00155A0EAC|nr:protein cornichon homolog 1 isoform X2 [Vitis riparia]XP_034692665.1 protein cornichon homolog 1 isoform X2 [Vitis riparia]XP_034692666.1 protein cornichon homolog 1 isoform X2 [Vitis riparia]XP_034692667.1 protein cornichon homolog 1 isoform X2 [Vitis riparia]